MADNSRIYSAGNEEDYAFLQENFIEGSKWEIFEWGESKGIFTVGDRFEMGGKVRNHVTRDRDNWRGAVFLFALVARPYYG